MPSVIVEIFYSSFDTEEKWYCNVVFISADEEIWMKAGVLCFFHDIFLIFTFLCRRKALILPFDFRKRTLQCRIRRVGRKIRDMREEYSIKSGKRKAGIDCKLSEEMRSYTKPGAVNEIMEYK